MTHLLLIGIGVAIGLIIAFLYVAWSFRDMHW